MDKVATVNLCLSMLGEYKIEDIDENSRQAELAKLHFDVTLDQVVAAHNWSEAVTRIELPALATPPNFEYTYQYQLPSDCLRVISINEVNEWQQSDAYVVEQGKVLTNEASVYLKYIRRLQITECSILLATIIAKSLAVNIAVGLTGSENKRQAILQEIIQVDMPKAFFCNAIQQRPARRLKSSRWDASRYGYYPMPTT